MVVIRSGSSITDPFAVFTRPSINFDHIPGLDESWHREFRPCFHGAWFRHVGRSIAFGARLALGNLQFNHRRRFNNDGFPVVQRRGADHPILEVFPDLARDFLFDFNLFKRLLVHEDVVFSLAIGECHVRGFNVRLFQRVATLVGAI